MLPLCRAFIVLALALIGLPAGAREDIVTTNRPAFEDPTRIQTLDKALERVPWEGERRGPLLVVDPQNTRRFQPRRQPGQPYTPPPPLPAPRADGYTLRAVAPYFDRKVALLGNLTVLVPTSMVLLSGNPGKGDAMAGLRRDEKLRLLMASLTPAQWRQIGSAPA